jgi:hypothetical protein
VTRFLALPTCLVALAATFAVAPSHAMTVHDVDMTCPIGGEKFSARMVGSGTAFGQYLDRRQFGATASPWPLAKCPKNGFVIFRDDFTAGEIAQLTAIVASADYRALQARETNYHVAAWLLRRLGAAPAEVFAFQLAATWEASDDERHDRYDRYAAEALATLEQVLAMPGAPVEDALDKAQLAAELERRLGRFDAAHRRLSALLPHVRGSGLEPLVIQELQLVDARDRAPHRVGPDDVPPAGRAPPRPRASEPK